ncbi:MAG: HD domain-containing protein [Bacteriovorax sp.]|nr:HD domain-containing protein [Bacteriovorax sp.]
MSKRLFKVLIVDPDKNGIDFLNTQLVRLQLTILFAGSGSEAKKLIVLQRPELIISETYLSDCYGMELLCWAEENYPQTKAILVTSDVDIITNKKISGDAYEILVKPFPIAELDRVLIKIFPTLLGTAEQKESQQCFMEISFEEFLSGTKALTSLYLKLSFRKYVKIINKGELVERDLIEKYKRKGIKSIYVESEEYDSYLELGLKASEVIKNRTDLSAEQKTKFFIHVSDIFQEKLYQRSFDENDFSQAQTLVLNTLEVAIKNKSIFDLLEMMKSNNNGLYTHCLAVSIYSVLLARRLDWSTDRTTAILAMGGLLHDIGQRNIPEELRKRHHSTYSENELKIWENHTISGAELLTRIENIPKEVFQIAMQHHEYADGSGFPFGLTSVHIFPLAKIVGLIDCFAYHVLPMDNKPPLTPLEAVNQIKNNRKGKFDPKMVEELERLIIC